MILERRLKGNFDTGPQPPSAVSAAVLWITAGVGYLTLEAIAAASFRPQYSYAHNYIGDLGVTCGGMIQVASSTLRWPTC